jgi:formate hydrogenlyase subunit 3/multisubunit Na+/H+ antiporter MnhD subunit
MPQDPKQVTRELREKIKSKMAVAKFFAGFITFLTGFLLKERCFDDLPSRIGVLFLVSAIGFCIAAVFAYDRLLMPRKYWLSLHEDAETEGRFQNEIHRNMTQSWKVLFVPAVVCFAIGFVFVIVPEVLLTRSGDKSVWDWQSTVLTLLLLVAVIAPVAVGFWRRPEVRD